MHRDGESLVQSHTAGWWWGAGVHCPLALCELHRVTSAFPSYLEHTASQVPTLGSQLPPAHSKQRSK